MEMLTDLNVLSNILGYIDTNTLANIKTSMSHALQSNIQTVIEHPLYCEAYWKHRVETTTRLIYPANTRLCWLNVYNALCCHDAVAHFDYICAAIKEGYVSIALTILTHTKEEISQINYHDIFCAMCKRGHPGGVRALLNDTRSRFDPSYDKSNACKIAIKYGHFGAVKAILGDIRILPTSENLDLISHAVAQYSAHILKLVLDFFGDVIAQGYPTIGLDICIACVEMEPDGVKMLLGLRGSRPEMASAMLLAVSSNRKDIVKLLLHDGRSNPAMNDNIALASACQNCNVSITELLLADPRVDPSGGNNAALRNAVSSLNLRFIELLLADHRIKAHLNGYDPIKEILGFHNIRYCSRFALPIIRVLVEHYCLHDTLDITANKCDYVFISIRRGLSDILELLLSYDSVVRALDFNKAFEKCGESNEACLRCLKEASTRR